MEGRKALELITPEVLQAILLASKDGVTDLRAEEIGENEYTLSAAVRAVERFVGWASYAYRLEIEGLRDEHVKAALQHSLMAAEALSEKERLRNRWATYAAAAATTRPSHEACEIADRLVRAEAARFDEGDE